MLTHGQEYTDRGQDYFEERYRQRVLHNLAQKAKAMGMQLVPSDNTAKTPVKSISCLVFLERPRPGEF